MDDAIKSCLQYGKSVCFNVGSFADGAANVWNLRFNMLKHVINIYPLLNITIFNCSDQLGWQASNVMNGTVWSTQANDFVSYPQKKHHRSGNSSSSGRGSKRSPPFKRERNMMYNNTAVGPAASNSKMPPPPPPQLSNTPVYGHYWQYLPYNLESELVMNIMKYIRKHIKRIHLIGMTNDDSMTSSSQKPHRLMMSEIHSIMNSIKLSNRNASKRTRDVYFIWGSNDLLLASDSVSDSDPILCNVFTSYSTSSNNVSIPIRFDGFKKVSKKNNSSDDTISWFVKHKILHVPTRDHVSSDNRRCCCCTNVIIPVCVDNKTKNSNKKITIENISNVLLLKRNGSDTKDSSVNRRTFEPERTYISVSPFSVSGRIKQQQKQHQKQREKCRDSNYYFLFVFDAKNVVALK